MQKYTPAPLRVDWSNCYSPAVSWVWLLETHVFIYYHGGESRYLVAY